MQSIDSISRVEPINRIESMDGQHCPDAQVQERKQSTDSTDSTASIDSINSVHFSLMEFRVGGLKVRAPYRLVYFIPSFSRSPKGYHVPSKNLFLGGVLENESAGQARDLMPKTVFKVDLDMEFHRFSYFFT